VLERELVFRTLNPNPHSLDYDGCEIISQQNQNRETPVITG
jgi:hypothetical protein